MEERPCPIKYINLHHTAGHEKNTEAIRTEHLNDKSDPKGDIGYNAVIEPDGSVGSIMNSDGETAPGRNIKWSGAHNRGRAPDGSGYTMNQKAYAISHIGNFENETFPDVMFDGSTKLCAQICKELKIIPSKDTIRRHSDDDATACPGKNFPFDKYVAKVIELYNSDTSTITRSISKHPIQGTETVTVEQCEQFLHKINPSAPDLAQYYKEYGEELKIMWGYAFAQMIKETNYLRFGGDVKAEQNNFAGIGATGGGVVGASFDSPELGVLAQMEHLYAYASTGGLSSDMQMVDPRFHLVTRGIAPNWEDLNGRWAVPGTNYGQEIAVIYDQIATEVVVKQVVTTSEKIDLGGDMSIELIKEDGVITRKILHADAEHYLDFNLKENGIWGYVKGTSKRLV